jgi:hypothetical protein
VHLHRSYLQKSYNFYYYFIIFFYIPVEEARTPPKVMFSVRICASEEMKHLSAKIVTLEMTLSGCFLSLLCIFQTAILLPSFLVVLSSEIFQFMCVKNKLNPDLFSLKLDDGVTEIPLAYTVKELGVGALTLSKKKKKGSKKPSILFSLGLMP